MATAVLPFGFWWPWLLLTPPWWPAGKGCTGGMQRSGEEATGHGPVASTVGTNSSLPEAPIPG